MSYHFVTGDFQPQKVFLPDKEYGLALDALVKGCADVLLTRGEGASLRILLGKRKVEPQPDWWFVGGRTRPGDTPAEGAARNVKRELGLAIETRRFVHVNTYSFVWNYRQQAPSTNGTADASTVFELPLTAAEADGLGPAKFDKNEYADAAWVGPLDILEGDYHPALQQAVRDLLAQRAYRDLRNVAGGPPAAVARCARRSGGGGAICTCSMGFGDASNWALLVQTWWMVLHLGICDQRRRRQAQLNHDFRKQKRPTVGNCEHKAVS